MNASCRVVLRNNEEVSAREEKHGENCRVALSKERKGHKWRAGCLEQRSGARRRARRRARVLH